MQTIIINLYLSFAKEMSVSLHTNKTLVLTTTLCHNIKYFVARLNNIFKKC